MLEQPAARHYEWNSNAEPNDDDELARRREAWQPPVAKYERGYGALFAKHVTQAHDGCDFDFLEAGGDVPEPEIH